jgi:DNA-binding NarL/FixJ family response regulator
MEQTHVVILSGQSLFAEGIASRLRQYLQLVNLEIVVPGSLDVVSQIIAARPSVVILDDTDPGIEQYCSLGKLLRLFPKLKVIILDLQQEQIQVVDSEQRLATRVHDLAQMIQPA